MKSWTYIHMTGIGYLADAEDATKLVFAEDGDAYLPEVLISAILKIAGIDSDETDKD